MFTGIVEGTGQVVLREPRAEATRLRIELGPFSAGINIGESIAVNGCCLTVTAHEGTQADFDLLHETEFRTNLQALVTGRVVNLERAMPAGGRYGGHFVTGHIDGTGKILQWKQVGKDFLLRIGITREQGVYVVPKGCVAIDGISLTVADVTAQDFTVWIIPHTRTVTALSERQVGDLVNLEFDLLAKYVEKILSVRSAA